MSKQTRTRQRLWILLGFIVVLLLARHYEEAPQPLTIDAENTAAELLFEQQQSGLQIEVHGQVQRLLDEDPAAAHQRFILVLESGHTLLITHNTELAPRIEKLAVGDKVTVYGEYLWNDQGGLMHWTHHDPANRHPHGWIRHQGRLYQ